MEGAWRKGVSKNRLYEVSTSKKTSTKFCEGFWDFVAVSSPTGPPFHELSTNSLGFYECPAPSTMLVEQVFAKPFLCTTLPFASERHHSRRMALACRPIGMEGGPRWGRERHQPVGHSKIKVAPVAYRASSTEPEVRWDPGCEGPV